MIPDRHDQIFEPDRDVFTLKTGACGPIDPWDPEMRDWKVSHYDYPAMDVFVYIDLLREDLCLTIEDGFERSK